jgi:hypothetical protein
MALAAFLLLFEGCLTMAAAPSSGTAAGGSSEEHLRQVRSFLRRVNKAPVKSIQVYIYIGVSIEFSMRVMCWLVRETDENEARKN